MRFFVCLFSFFLNLYLHYQFFPTATIGFCMIYTPAHRTTVCANRFLVVNAGQTSFCTVQYHRSLLCRLKGTVHRLIYCCNVAVQMVQQ